MMTAPSTQTTTSASKTGEDGASVSRRYLEQGHILELDLRGYDFSTYVSRLREELLPNVTAWNTKSLITKDVKSSSGKENEDVEIAERQQLMVNKAYQLFVAHAPPELLDELLRFPVAPDAPVAIAVRGLPVDDPLPPSPQLGSLDAHDDENARPDSTRIVEAGGKVMAPRGERRKECDDAPKAPLAEAVMLGLARVLGVPTTHVKVNGGRGLLAYSLLPPASECDGETPLTHLYLHRDFPSTIIGQRDELDAFILYAMRGDANHNAYTTVVSADAVLQATPPEDIALLRLAPLHCEIDLANAPGEPTRPLGDITWQAISGPDENDPIITFFSLDFGVRPNPFVTHRVASDTPGAADAYARLLERAEQMADHIYLDTGSALIINNLKAMHGRTGFTPRKAGHPLQRWFVKTYVSFCGWRPRGTASPSALQFPKFHME